MAKRYKPTLTEICRIQTASAAAYGGDGVITMKAIGKPSLLNWLRSNKLFIETGVRYHGSARFYRPTRKGAKMLAKVCQIPNRK